MRIWICIEKAGDNYSAYAPAVTGCISTGKTIEETRANMEEALAFHLEDGNGLESLSNAFPFAENIYAHNEDEYYTLIDVETADARVGV